MLTHKLYTPHGEKLLANLLADPNTEILPEYPRPQLVRETTWLNLNGRWAYKIDLAEEGDLDPVTQVPVESRSITEPIARFRNFDPDGEILVPFSPETLLSGVDRQVMPENRLWYKRTFNLSPEITQAGQRVLLHAGAIDQVCSIWINDKYLGSHRDGYLPFSFDMTDLLRTDQEEQSIVIVVRDPSNRGQLPWGKQKIERGKIWYTPQSGIWQTIWLEIVPETYVENVTVRPFWEGGGFDFTYKLGGTSMASSADSVAGANTDADADADSNSVAAVGSSAQLRLLAEGEEVGRIELREGVAGRVTLAKAHSWTPEDPFLYDWELTLRNAAGEAIDRVTGYCGLRSVALGEDEAGNPCILLNGEVSRQSGVLDQGYWSDGLYTAASDDALVDDILMVKKLGFNMIRKHIKIEPQRWYYHCDRLGMLVWQDIVNGGNSYRFSVIRALPFVGIRLKDKHYKLFGRTGGSRRNGGFGRNGGSGGFGGSGGSATRNDMALAGAKGRAAQRMIVKETIEALYNTVSIIQWTPFNEGWGQFDARKIAKEVKEMDPTRLVDHASGYHDQGGPDFNSLHVYYKKFKPAPDPLLRPLALTEYGGYSLPVEGHMSSDALYGYRAYSNPLEYQKAVVRLIREELLPVKQLTSAVYSQLSDVEDEINGLVTFDRKVNKWADEEAEAELRQVNEELIYGE